MEDRPPHPKSFAFKKAQKLERKNAKWKAKKKSRVREVERNGGDVYRDPLAMARDIQNEIQRQREDAQKVKARTAELNKVKKSERVIKNTFHAKETLQGQRVITGALESILKKLQPAIEKREEEIVQKQKAEYYYGRIFEPGTQTTHTLITTTPEGKVRVKEQRIGKKKNKKTFKQKIKEDYAELADKRGGNVMAEASKFDRREDFGKSEAREILTAWLEDRRKKKGYVTEDGEWNVVGKDGEIISLSDNEAENQNKMKKEGGTATSGKKKAPAKQDEQEEDESEGEEEEGEGEEEDRNQAGKPKGRYAAQVRGKGKLVGKRKERVEPGKEWPPRAPPEKRAKFNAEEQTHGAGPKARPEDEEEQEEQQQKWVSTWNFKPPAGEGAADSTGKKKKKKNKKKTETEAME